MIFLWVLGQETRNVYFDGLFRFTWLGILTFYMKPFYRLTPSKELPCLVNMISELTHHSLPIPSECLLRTRRLLSYSVSSSCPWRPYRSGLVTNFHSPWPDLHLMVLHRPWYKHYVESIGTDQIFIYDDNFPYPGSHGSEPWTLEFSGRSGHQKGSINYHFPKSYICFITNLLLGWMTRKNSKGRVGLVVSYKLFD